MLQKMRKETIMLFWFLMKTLHGVLPYINMGIKMRFNRILKRHMKNVMKSRSDSRNAEFKVSSV